jgi:hypothetical protein
MLTFINQRRHRAPGDEAIASDRLIIGPTPTGPRRPAGRLGAGLRYTFATLVARDAADAASAASSTSASLESGKKFGDSRWK